MEHNAGQSSEYYTSRKPHSSKIKIYSAIVVVLLIFIAMEVRPLRSSRSLSMPILAQAFQYPGAYQCGFLHTAFMCYGL